MKKVKFIYSILVVLMVVATGIQKVSAQVLHNVIVPKGDNLPVKDAMYAQAAKGELKGYFYGGSKGYDRKIEVSRYLFNFSDNLRNLKTLPMMNGKHPVTQIQYVDVSGKFVEKDTITAEGAIMILSDYNLAYGYDADFPSDSISAAFCHEDGTYDFRTRAVRPGEKRRMIVGVTLYSKGPTGCGNDVDIPAEKLGGNERTGDQSNQNAITDNTGLKASADNRQGNQNASFTIDTLGHTMVFNFQNIGGNASINNSGNSQTTAPAADQGSFQRVEYQDVVNHGYDNVPYVYNAQYYQWQEPGQQPQYVYRSGNQWLYAAGGFAVGVVVGALLDNLFTTCNNNQATGCGYGYNGTGGVVVNNYNYNNNTNTNTVNTGGNPPPNPNPTGGPVTVPNGPTATGGPVTVPNGPVSVSNGGNPQNGGNRNQPYVYNPQGNVQGSRPAQTQQANQGQSRPAQQAQPAPTQSRGNTNVNPAPRPAAPQPTTTVQSRPAPRPAPAPSGVVVRGNSMPRAR